MTVTGTLTPDSWVPVLYQISVFSTQIQCRREHDVSQIHAKGMPGFSQKCSAGPKYYAYLCDRTYWGSWRVARPAPLKCQCPWALLFCGGKYQNAQPSLHASVTSSKTRQQAPFYQVQLM